MKKMTEGTSSIKWILAIIGAVLTGFLYLVCCVCSIHKALKDRREIIERNCAKRNEKYLKEMGIDSAKSELKSGRNAFAISKGEDNYQNPILEKSIDEPQPLEKPVFTNYPLTKAKKINLDDIDEILNESLSAVPSTNSSTVGKTQSENSQSANLIDEEIKSDMPIVTSLRKPIIIESVPKYYYLKAHNSHLKEKSLPSNWITERLNNASSFAEAQRQLQYGSKRAPLAKQNSGFSSMDEDSSASYNY